MLLNRLLFWMMIAEGAVCLVISLPFGQSVSLSVINFLSKQLGGKDSKASLAATILLALISLMFICAYRSSAEPGRVSVYVRTVC
jgi:hypothetical protein